MVRLILPRQIGEAAHLGRLAELDDDFMRMLGVGILPLGMPESFWIAINCIGAFAVLAGSFFAVHANDLQRGFRRVAGILHHANLGG